MSDDSTIEEARRAGQSYVDSFQGDWSALIDDLRRRAVADGRQILSLPPKPPRRPAVASVK